MVWKPAKEASALAGKSKVKAGVLETTRSPNLTLGGERFDGDDLRVIRDADVATAFVIEAVTLVDHYRFLDRLAQAADATPAALVRHPDKRIAAETAGWFLETTDAWTDKYFDARDLHCAERGLFGH